jgi:hypothetical protein
VFLAAYSLDQGAGEATWIGGYRGATETDFKWMPLFPANASANPVDPSTGSNPLINDFYAPWAPYSLSGTTQVNSDPQPNVPSADAACTALGFNVQMDMSSNPDFLCSVDCPPNHVFNGSEVCNGYSGENLAGTDFFGNPNAPGYDSGCGYLPEFAYEDFPNAASHTITQVIPCPGSTGNDGFPTVANGCPFLPWTQLTDLPCDSSTANPLQLPGYFCKVCEFDDVSGSLSARPGRYGVPDPSL